ncbi:hypothetical protein ACJMK2_041387 [Sinanodonta woodiana]|uniref:Uncharacterized protein n=1 Tax=Sinanodonta woodiana TaxID=1069815 RepID=A0ABD3W5B3_SINWO
MPKYKREEWKHVLVLDYKDNVTLSYVSCIYYDKECHGGVIRIRGHLHGNPKCGIRKCSKVQCEVQQTLKKQGSVRLKMEVRIRYKRNLDALEKATSRL